eukprot:542407-Prorocentrum_minimum.AAC.1
MGVRIQIRRAGAIGGRNRGGHGGPPEGGGGGGGGGAAAAAPPPSRAASPDAPGGGCPWCGPRRGCLGLARLTAPRHDRERGRRGDRDRGPAKGER